jgi:hypothetical protein
LTYQKLLLAQVPEQLQMLVLVLPMMMMRMRNPLVPVLVLRKPCYCY